MAVHAAREKAPTPPKIAVGERPMPPRKKESPAKTSPQKTEKAPAAVPALPKLMEWTSHRGGSSSLFAPGDRFLYGALGRFLEVWQAGDTRPLAFLDTGYAIRDIAVYAEAEREWLVAVTEAPQQLLSFTYAEAEGLKRQGAMSDSGRAFLLPEGIFLQADGILRRYEMKPDGNFLESLRLSLGDRDRFYPFEEYLAFYRSAAETLELWHGKRKELLAGILVGGDPEPFGVYREKDSSGEMAPFLYLLIRSEDGSRFVAIRKIPLDAETRLFLGPGEEWSFPNAETAILVKRHPKEPRFYFKSEGTAPWRVLNFKNGQPELLPQPLQGEPLPSPVSSKGKIYLVEAGGIREAKPETGEPVGELLMSFQSPPLSVPPVEEAAGASSLSQLQTELAGDLEEVFDGLALDVAETYVAVAGGGEGLVVLKRDPYLGDWVRLHRAQSPVSGVRAERLFLSPDRSLLFLLCRDTRKPDAPQAFLNLYDVADPRFPRFATQLSGLSLLGEGKDAALPRLVFTPDGRYALLAVGAKGLGILNLKSDLKTLSLVTDNPLGKFPISDVSADPDNTAFCTAAGEFGLLCGKFVGAAAATKPASQ